MRWAVAVLGLLTACSATATILTTTTESPCLEARKLWDTTFEPAAIDIEPLERGNSLDALSEAEMLDEVTRRGQQQSAKRRAELAAVYTAIENRAVLAEQHPGCFTVKERLDAETARRRLPSD